MQRVIIIILAVVVTLPVIFKSRGGEVKSAPAAFAVSSSDKVLVRVSGDVRHAGIYEVSANAMADSVIYLAGVNDSVRHLIPKEISAGTVENGTDIQLKIMPDGTGRVAVGLIPAGERMILGVPLDINTMTEADFDRLPGVGPSMAKRIIEYRQKNGGKMKVEELLDIEGIGEMKYNKIRIYF